MAAYAWYYCDHEHDTVYWSYSRDNSTSGFAEKVSRKLGRTISAADTSYSNDRKDLEKHLRHDTVIQIY